MPKNFVKKNSRTRDFAS